MKRIFISSVQKEFAEVRKLLKRYVLRNPAYQHFFETFVFEEDVTTKSYQQFSSMGSDPMEVRPILRRVAAGLQPTATNLFRKPLNEPLNEPLKSHGMTDLAVKIYEFIYKHPGIKQRSLALQLNRSAATIKRQIELLSGYVEYRGSKKTGGYFANNIKPQTSNLNSQPSNCAIISQ